ncbi:single-stranded DNA-binding protein [Candidatus Saccharibacteria bacterium]|nr:single-stranded DNA-binding protein [Candidatus Saccharibacteria bacterium]
MARGFSKVVIMGNLTRDPENRSTTSGTNVTSFSVAVNRSYKDSGGNQKEDVSFFDCTAWGKMGETIAQYAKKGTGILLSGRLSQQTWEDKNSGQKRSRVEIVVEDFNFVGGGNGGDGYTPSSSKSSSKSNKSDDSDNDAEVVPEDIPEDDGGEVSLDEIPF